MNIHTISIHYFPQRVKFFLVENSFRIWYNDFIEDEISDINS